MAIEVDVARACLLLGEEAQLLAAIEDACLGHAHRLFSSDMPVHDRWLPRNARLHSLAKVERGISSALAKRLAWLSVRRSPVSTPMCSEKWPSSCATPNRSRQAERPSHDRAGVLRDAGAAVRDVVLRRTAAAAGLSITWSSWANRLLTLGQRPNANPQPLRFRAGVRSRHFLTGSRTQSDTQFGSAFPFTP